MNTVVRLDRLSEHEDAYVGYCGCDNENSIHFFEEGRKVGIAGLASDARSIRIDGKDTEAL
jgi:hypothetical protein